ncbi:hypothetical protein [Mesonia maritima]|uniref:Uncharacterized protein n=1 Tax=Mesonia maritima TaxID=1793873 RepID=A0ABU1K5Z5_9FLAO|nr:hypothetical protein [Mesonia maritima]MDR6301036.1 hypothetical protein [Mesonia maritima]
MSSKYRLLFKGLLFDGIGMISMAIPVIGPFLDIIWAPVATKQMQNMYPNKQGKIASVIVFMEEILPWTDVVPTFTLMWVYSYIIKQKSAQKSTSTL